MRRKDPADRTEAIEHHYQVGNEFCGYELLAVGRGEMIGRPSFI